jgi:hypothetical protein
LLLLLLARSATLFLVLARSLSRLLVILAALFLLPPVAPTSLRVGFGAGPDDCYRCDGQESCEALNTIEFHESSYTDLTRGRLCNSRWQLAFQPDLSGNYIIFGKGRMQSEHRLVSL